MNMHPIDRFELRNLGVEKPLTTTKLITAVFTALLKSISQKIGLDTLFNPTKEGDSSVKQKVDDNLKKAGDFIKGMFK